MLSLILPSSLPRLYQFLHDRWYYLSQNTALTTFDIFILIPYLAILVILAVYGFHRYHLVYLYLKHKNKIAKPKAILEVKSRVTVQLPVYNELYVVERLIEASCNIRYPRDLLEIQVLDDSTDGTAEVASVTGSQHRPLPF